VPDQGLFVRFNEEINQRRSDRRRSISPKDHISVVVESAILRAYHFFSSQSPACTEGFGLDRSALTPLFSTGRKQS
jgi:hypothetical protein